jgi:ATP-dependent Clp protease ATP-binding subunit ClpA
MHRALTYARQRQHHYAIVEHLLLALIDDVDACVAMKACKVDLGALYRQRPENTGNRRRRRTKADCRLSARDSARGALCRGTGLPRRTGAELLVAIFAETESPAARLLGGQDMTRQDAVNFIIHGIAKGGGESAA